MKYLFLALSIIFFSSSISGTKKENKTFVLRDSASKKSSSQQNSLSKFGAFINILGQEKKESLKYQQQAASLFVNVQNNASLETLELLSNLYKDKRDFKNQIKILKVATFNHEHTPKVHVLLGDAHKELYLQNQSYEHLQASIQSFYKAIAEARKQNYKYEKAHIKLLPLLKKYSQSAYLELVQSMVRQFKRPQYYTELCEAYFENRLIKQSRTSCKNAIRKNPKDPRGQYFLNLGNENQKLQDKTFIKLATEFPNSYFIQFKVGQYFTTSNPIKAAAYLKKACQLNPQSAEAHKHLGWVLFNMEKEEESYDHFKKACLLRPRYFFKDLKLAKIRFENKKQTITKNIASRIRLNLKFKKGIRDCTKKMREKVIF